MGGTLRHADKDQMHNRNHEQEIQGVSVSVQCSVVQCGAVQCRGYS